MDDDFFQRRVGTVLCGKWTLERLLGVGGMAAVYVGRHHIGRRDAIKVLHPSAGRTRELRARFEQEAHAVARLGHPGAVRVDDIDTAEDGSIFLVMELLDGETLAERASRAGCATIDETLRWADDLLDVLAAAHAIGIVHRDIKPDNVFLTRDGRIKLLDFGIARMRDPQGESMHTATGVAIGTMPYMPPEQARGLPIDARADLFALGATMVRLIAGRTVHDAGSDAELFLKMASEPAPPVHQLAPNLGADACAVIDRALAFDRDRRYPDARSMQSDVRALRAGQRPAVALSMVPVVAATTPGVPAHTSPDAAPRRRSPIVAWVLAGSIVAGSLAAGALLWAITGDEEASVGAEHGDAALGAAEANHTDPGVDAGTAPTLPATTSTGATTRPVAPRPAGSTTAPPASAPTPPGAAPPNAPRQPPRPSDDDDDDDDDRKDRDKEKGRSKKDKEGGKKGKGRGRD